LNLIDKGGQTFDGGRGSSGGDGAFDDNINTLNDRFARQVKGKLGTAQRKWADIGGTDGRTVEKRKHGNGLSLLGVNVRCYDLTLKTSAFRAGTRTMMAMANPVTATVIATLTARRMRLFIFSIPTISIGIVNNLF
jgi:hypothetical protein